MRGKRTASRKRRTSKPCSRLCRVKKGSNPPLCAMNRASSVPPFTPIRFRLRSSLLIVPTRATSTPNRASEATSSRPESTSSTLKCRCVEGERRVREVGALKWAGRVGVKITAGITVRAINYTLLVAGQPSMKKRKFDTRVFV